MGKWVAFISIMHLVPPSQYHAVDDEIVVYEMHVHAVCCFLSLTCVSLHHFDNHKWEYDWKSIEQVILVYEWANWMGLVVAYSSFHDYRHEPWMQEWTAMNVYHLTRCGCCLCEIHFSCCTDKKGKWFLKPEFNSCCRPMTTIPFNAATIKHQDLIPQTQNPLPLSAFIDYYCSIKQNELSHFYMSDEAFHVVPFSMRSTLLTFKKQTNEQKTENKMSTKEKSRAM